MRFTADTNVIVRAMTGDDPVQSPLAQRRLEQAHQVVLPTAVLCEVAWVLATTYRFTRSELADAFRQLLATPNIALDQAAAEAGLALLEAGGDFADGAIAQEGAQRGAPLFLSFDERAVKLLRRADQAALPAEL